MASPRRGRPVRRPWGQRQARTTFLRVPSCDWINVKRGIKTEFRMSGNLASTDPLDMSFPHLVVAYRQRNGHGGSNPFIESKLMVLEGRWEESLAAISEDSLKREGFKSFADFRTYWMGRTRNHFEPNEVVQAFRVRPPEESELPVFAERLLADLLGPWLPTADETWPDPPTEK